MCEALPFRQMKLASLQLLSVTAELFFRGLALLNIQAGSIPFENVSVVVANRHFAVEHPAVFSVGSADARFVFEDFSARQRASPLVHNPVDVLRMNESRPIPAGHLVQSGAQVFHPGLAEVG